MPYNLSIVDEKIETLELPGIAASWTDANIANSVNRIGEFKVYTVTINSDISIASTSFYVQPALFAQKTKPNLTTGVPPYFYSCQSVGTITPGATIVSTYNGGALPTAEVGKIQYVWIKTVSSTQFQVIIAWYMGVDKEGYLDPNLYTNHDYFLKNKRTNPNELDTTGNSVYDSTSIDIRAYIYLQNTVAPGIYGSIDINQQRGFKGGFYNKGTHGAAPYFSAAAWVAKINSVAGNSFSTILNTDVEFSCVCPSGLNTTVVMHLIHVNSYDDTVQFQTNYGMDTKFIDSGESNSTKIIGAFTGPVLVGGSTYKWTFKIDKNNIVSGEIYRMIAIVRYNNFPTNYEVTSFISDEYLVNADVPYNGGGISISGILGDVKSNYTGNQLTACIEERMRSRIVFDFAADSWKDNVFNRLGITTVNDPRRYLTFIEFTIKEEYNVSSYPGIFREIYDYRFATKTGATSYTAKTGIDITETGATQLTFIAEWRNRWESAQPNIESWVNGVQQLVPLGNQDWGGKTDMLVEWKFHFYYDDYVTPFTDIISFTQKLTVRDYVDDTVLKIVAQNPPFDTKEFWCNGEEMCLQGEIVDTGVINPADVYRLITNVDGNPGGLSTLLEEEAWVPPILGQSTNNIVYAQDQDFDAVGGVAEFCLDESNLVVGQEYKVTVLAKKS